MRRARDWSQTQAFEALRVGLRLGPRSRASYVRLDMGDRPPTPREMAFLVDYFGQNPDDAPRTDERDPLVAALERQSEAIDALVNELRLAREGHPVNNNGPHGGR